MRRRQHQGFDPEYCRGKIVEVKRKIVKAKAAGNRRRAQALAMERMVLEGLLVLSPSAPC